MAPKRAAKKAAPPPPPPPEESSYETSLDESEDEDAMDDSPVSAPTLKNTPAPSQKGVESESSDEEDDDSEEEETAPAAPKNQPPPPQKKESSETSGDEEEDEEDDDDEEEEEPTRAPPSSAQKKQPRQTQEKEDSDTSGDEEEGEEEAAPPKPDAKKQADVVKPPTAAETKKPAAFKRIWSPDDDLRILQALVDYQKQEGSFPHPDALVRVLAGKLDNTTYGSRELQSKVQALRAKYLTISKRAELPSKEHDRRVLELSKLVWTGKKASAPAANSHECKGFEEMCKLYPYVAEEVKKLEAAQPGMYKRVFGKMQDDKARTMDEKIMKQRKMQIKVEMRKSDLVKEVTKVLLDLLD